MKLKHMKVSDTLPKVSDNVVSLKGMLVDMTYIVWMEIHPFM